MSFSLKNQLRIAQTRSGFYSLQKEIDEWLSIKEKDERIIKQYKTPLNSLKTILTTSLTGLCVAFSNVGINNQTVGEVYRSCRNFDSRLVAVRRIWQFFRDKFDQRNKVEFQPVLAAADEIVWSCYKQVYQSLPAGSNIATGPAPLPYIEALFSPQATPRTAPPPEFKNDLSMAFISDYLKELPIPILSLPPFCIDSPWWLIYIGHEVGHHIQFDLLPNWGLVTKFKDLLVKTVSEFHADKENAAERWGTWGREIFADIFSIYNMGPASLWAMAELELSDSQTMSKNRALYPSPIVRLTLMATLIDQLFEIYGKLGSNILQDLNFEEINDDAILKDLSIIPKLVENIIAWELDGLGTFEDLTKFRVDDFDPDQGEVIKLTNNLLKSQVNAKTNLRYARLAASASLTAWRILSESNDDKLNEKQILLRDNSLKLIRESREDSTRASTPAIRESYPSSDLINKYAEDLTKNLLEANWELES